MSTDTTPRPPDDNCVWTAPPAACVIERRAGDRRTYISVRFTGGPTDLQRRGALLGLPQIAERIRTSLPALPSFAGLRQLEHTAADNPALRHLIASKIEEVRSAVSADTLALFADAARQVMQRLKARQGELFAALAAQAGPVLNELAVVSAAFRIVGAELSTKASAARLVQESLDAALAGEKVASPAESPVSGAGEPVAEQEHATALA
jgi:hypothetical protein